MDGDTPSRGGVFFSPLCIFLISVALHALDGFLQIAKKKGLRNPEEVQLRKEIKELLKEATSLSTPSTFAQAAMLRRRAAAKEKELLRRQEEHMKGKLWLYVFCGKVLLVFKVLFYGALLFLLWGVPVAIVPEHLVQPFGRVLSWAAGRASTATGQVMVGIVPWLVLTHLVSKFLWEKCQKTLFKYCF